ncbi:MAG: GIY-YIG nuclease family protein [Patescibacteria group bacterium]|nr:GIY-YIG nuclease family protein [Patescibacteria group bacterium]
MGKWHIYIVRCADGSLYTGIATDLGARIAKHNSGTGAKYTRSHRPVSLVWTEAMRSESAARRKEAAIKKMDKTEKETFIKGPRHEI